MSGTVVIERIAAEDLDIGIGGISLTAPGGGDMPATRINLATFGIIGKFSVPIGTLTTSYLSYFTLTGVRAGMPVSWGISDNILTPSIVLNVWAVADNTIRMNIVNTGAPVVVGTVTFTVIAFPIPTPDTFVVATQG